MVGLVGLVGWVCWLVGLVLVGWVGWLVGLLFFFDKKTEMKNYSDVILSEGGEGVILRKPKSLYENGKSENLLKYKVCCIIVVLFLFNYLHNIYYLFSMYEMVRFY